MDSSVEPQLRFICFLIYSDANFILSNITNKTDCSFISNFKVIRKDASRKNRLQPPHTVWTAELWLLVSATTENKGELMNVT